MRNRWLDLGLFAGVALASLVLDSACDRALGFVLGGKLGWVRTLHLLPLLLSAALYIACGPGDSWKFPRGDVKRGWLVVPAWIAAFGFVLGMHMLIRKDVSRGAVALAVVDLMVTHIIAQELLFRGGLVALGNRVWPELSGDFDDMSFRVAALSSLAFGLAQLQYNPTLFAAAPWWQALRALVLGFFMVALRGSMRSLWAGAMFHVFNNFVGGVH